MIREAFDEDRPASAQLAPRDLARALLDAARTQLDAGNAWLARAAAAHAVAMLDANGDSVPPRSCACGTPIAEDALMCSTCEVARERGIDATADYWREVGS